MDSEFQFYAAFVLVIAGSGFIQSFFGFGYAVVALSILPAFMDIRLANLVVSLSVIVPMFLVVWKYRPSMVGAEIGACLLGSAVFMPIGLWAFAVVPADWLVRGTGLIILALMLDSLRTASPETVSKPRPGQGVLAGAASGFLSGCVGIGGPPIAAYATRRLWPPNQYKSFVTSFLLLASILKAVMAGTGGLVTRDMVVMAAVAVPFGLVGVASGIRASRHVDGRRFRRLTQGVLAIIAVSMIVRGNVNSPDEPENLPGAATASRALPRAPERSN